MMSGFRVGAYVTPAALREFNLGEWRKGPPYYFGRSRRWWRPEREILRAIDNPVYDIALLLQAVPAYPATDAGFRKAWAHHMAVHAGCHAWPNANHRTVMLSFNFALAAAQGRVVGFVHPERGAQLVQRSHAQRDADGGDYAHQELADPGHPYRRIFSEASRDIAMVSSADASRLAIFGPSPPE